MVIRRSLLFFWFWGEGKTKKKKNLNMSISILVSYSSHSKNWSAAPLSAILKITGIHTRKWYNKEDKRYNLDQVPPISVGVVQGASVLWGRLIPPPLTEMPGNFTVLALLTRFESRYTTITVVSSWKWRRTPRSIFFKSEYLISLFFAASWSAAFTSLLALPWKKERRWNMKPLNKRFPNQGKALYPRTNFSMQNSIRQLFC